MDVHFLYETPRVGDFRGGENVDSGRSVVDPWFNAIPWASDRTSKESGSIQIILHYKKIPSARVQEGMDRHHRSQSVLEMLLLRDLNLFHKVILDEIPQSFRHGIDLFIYA